MQLTGHVLIVDDESHVRLFISLIVRTLGPVVIHQAASGEDGIRLFQTLQPSPDLVILDINMPGLSGIETLRRLRDAGASCPVVMLTSLATRQTVEDALASGGSAFIRKDTPKAEIAELLMDAWRGAREQVAASDSSEARRSARPHERPHDVAGARREAAWDQDWFR